MKQMLRDLAAFFSGHWPHMIIAVPAAIAFTVVHELAHCAAVWVQGGRVTDFVWLPSGDEWGHMEYVFPAGAQYNATAVSLAPCAFWIICSLLAGMLALKRSPWRFRSASVIYVWLFIAPVADIAYAAAPYLLWSADNDFHKAFGPVRPMFVVIAIACAALVACYGYFLNKRIYRDRALGLPAYAVLTATAAIVIIALSSLGVQ